jgi:hypothetical protein
VIDGVEVRALCRPVKFFHTDLDKPFLYGPRFVHGGIVMLKQETAFLKLFPQSFPSLELRGLARTMKNSPEHYNSSIKHCSWHLPNPDLSIGLPDGKA